MNNKLATLMANRGVQKIVLDALIDSGYVTTDSKSFGNMGFTKLGNDTIKNPIEVDPKFISDFIALWPEGNRSTPGPIKSTYIRYFVDHPTHTYDMILKAAEKWIEDKGEYCGKAIYFFEKTISTGIKESRCEEYIELISKQVRNVQNINNKAI